MKETDVLRRTHKPDTVPVSVSRILCLSTHRPQSYGGRNVGLNNWCPVDCNCQLNKPATQEHMFTHKILNSQIGIKIY